MELAFQRQPGVVSTAVGYAGGKTKNPSYTQARRAAVFWLDTAAQPKPPDGSPSLAMFRRCKQGGRNAHVLVAALHTPCIA